MSDSLVFHPLFEQALKDSQIKDHGEKINQYYEPYYHTIFDQWLVDMYGDSLNEENWTIVNLYSCLKRHYKEESDLKIKIEKRIRESYRKTGRPLPNKIWVLIKENHQTIISIIAIIIAIIALFQKC